MRTKIFENKGGGRWLLKLARLKTTLIGIPILLFLLLFGHTLHAQSNCSSAVSIQGEDTCFSISSGTEYWIHFIGQSPHIKAEAFASSSKWTQCWQ